MSHAFPIGATGSLQIAYDAALVPSAGVKFSIHMRLYCFSLNTPQRYITLRESPANQWAIFNSATNISWVASYATTSATGSFPWLPLKRWIDVVFVFDYSTAGTFPVMYVDGRVNPYTNSGTSVGAPSGATGPLLVGNRAGGAGPADAAFSEVTLWVGRMLTQADALAISRYGPMGQPRLRRGMTAHYTLDNRGLYPVPNDVSGRAPLTAGPLVAGIQHFATPSRRMVRYQLQLMAKASAGGTVYTLACNTGAFALAGQAAGIPILRKLAAATGTFVETGQAAGLPVKRNLTAAAGAFTVTGKAAGLPVVRVCAAVAGAFTLAGQNTALRVNRALSCSSGSFVVAGQAARLPIIRALLAGAGSFVVTGKPAVLQLLRRMVAGTGSVVVTGNPIQITIIGANSAVAGPEPHTVDFLARIAEVFFTVSDARVDFTGIDHSVEFQATGTTVDFD